MKLRSKAIFFLLFLGIAVVWGDRFFHQAGAVDEMKTISYFVGQATSATSTVSWPFTFYIGDGITSTSTKSAFFEVSGISPNVSSLTIDASMSGGQGGTDIVSNVVDTSTSIAATASSFQRKVFWDSVNNLYWAFYANGTAVEYSNSPDGASWTSRGTTASSTNDFSVWPVTGSTTIYMVYYGGNVKVQKGTLGPTSISWGSASTVNSDSLTSNVNISRDSAGKLWVVFVYVVPADSDKIYAYRSTNADDISAWGAVNTIDSMGNLTAGDGADYPVAVPLNTAGDMYFVWTALVGGSGTDYVRGRLWDDSAGTPLQPTQTIESGTGIDPAALSAVSAATDIVHLTYIASGNAKYAKYSSGAWGSPITLDSNSGNSSAALSIDNNNSDNLYVFWIRSNVVYMKKGVSSYGSANWDSTATSLITTGTNTWLSSAYRDGNNYIPFIWTEGTASPFNVRFYGKGACTLRAALDTTGRSNEFWALYDVTSCINASAKGEYSRTLNVTLTGGSVDSLSANFYISYQHTAPTNNGATAMKTISYSADEGTMSNFIPVVQGILNFNLYMGDDIAAIKSAFFEISGNSNYWSTPTSSVSLSLGGGSGSCQLNVVLDTNEASSPFSILHDVTSCINIGTKGVHNRTLTLSISNGDANIYIYTARIYLTYQFTPPSAGGYPVSGTIISPIYDTGAVNGATYNWIKVVGTTATGTKVRAQIATSNSSSGPWTYLGPDCTGSSYYIDGLLTDGSQSREIGCFTNHHNKRYFRYQLILCSGNCSTAGSDTPQVNDVIVNWSP